MGCIFEKIYIYKRLFNKYTRYFKDAEGFIWIFAAQLSLMSSLVDRHNVRFLALNIVMKPGPTVELRRLNHSLFMLLKVE